MVMGQMFMFIYKDCHTWLKKTFQFTMQGEPNITKLQFFSIMTLCRSSARLKNIATQVPDWTDEKGF